MVLKRFLLIIFICGVIVAIIGVFSFSETPAMLGGIIIFASYVLFDLLGSNK